MAEESGEFDKTEEPTQKLKGIATIRHNRKPVQYKAIRLPEKVRPTAPVAMAHRKVGIPSIRIRWVSKPVRSMTISCSRLNRRNIKTRTR